MAKARTVVVDHSRDRARWGTHDARRPARSRGGANALSPVEGFGSNPGALSMLAFAPKDLPSGSPLVVVLHGCTQNAVGYDTASGWSRLAEELKFAVVFPEQRQANNAGGCFNWFQTADSARGLGETRSIHEMVEFMVSSHRIDRGRIYVTGLSAGGAMTAALLADYPEMFAAGAVIAGLPCGSAGNLQEALRAMSSPDAKSPGELGDLVRSASSSGGPWPRVLIMHGDQDKTVSPQNADALVSQWLNVHDVSPDDFRESKVGRHSRKIWSAGGRPVVESIMIADMDHGAPLDGAFGEREAPFMLNVGLSSTRRIADFFGIGGALEIKAAMAAKPVVSAASSTRGDLERQKTAEATRAPNGEAPGSAPAGRFAVGALITKALKRVGLIR